MLLAPSNISSACLPSLGQGPKYKNQWVRPSLFFVSCSSLISLSHSVHLSLSASLLRCSSALYRSHSMNLQTLKFHVSYGISTSKSNISHSPQALNGIFPPICSKIGASSICNCKGVEASIPKTLSTSLNLLDNGGVECMSRGLTVKDADVATLSNLCVDIVLNVQSLPPPSFEERLAYMEELSTSSPDKQNWEAGGNCNMVIAAARLGLNCLTLGHVGNEIYGSFLRDVLRDEGIGMVGISGDIDVAAGGASYETLLCWVLVDPLHRHGFCSRADFRKEPAFSWMAKLSEDVKRGIKRSKVLFCNGYTFDELSSSLIISALEYATEVGTSIFFDPGPRGSTLRTGTPEQQKALDQCLRMSNVLLLTSDEAESLTGITNPILAGQELLKKGVRTEWVIVKMGSKGSILITASSITCAPAFKVNVVDTVGCGDSYVAAVACGFINDMPKVNTLTLANAVGAATATGCGAGRNVATLEKVIDLIRVAELNEDENLWNFLLQEIPDMPEITILSKTSVNQRNSPVNQVSLQKVVFELLPRLETVKLKRIVQS